MFSQNGELLCQVQKKKILEKNNCLEKALAIILFSIYKPSYNYIYTYAMQQQLHLPGGNLHTLNSLILAGIFHVLCSRHMKARVL